MKISSLLAVSFMLFALIMLSVASEEKTGITADQGIQKLMEGNARFASGNVTHQNQTAERRAELLTSQSPFAVIMSCSDSRVPPEVIFDQGLGDLFVVRTAGEVQDNLTIGSIEYAVDHLNVPLVVVLGHDVCGAVQAAVEGGETHGHIGSIVEAIKPAVDEARNESMSTRTDAQLLNASIDNNVRNVVKALNISEPILAEKVKEGKLKIVGARYRLDTGAVEILN